MAGIRSRRTVESIVRGALRAGASLAAFALAASPATALVYQFDTTSGLALPGCAAPLVSTFTVSSTFTVATASIGLNVTHPSRGQVFVSLQGPTGGASTILPGTSGDTDDNYDILLSTNDEGALDDGDIDPIAAPIYNRLVEDDDLDDFVGDSASGTWTLRICDNQGGPQGTFHSARLILTDATAATTVCSSRILLDWTAFGDEADFTSTVVGGVTVTETSATDIGGTGAFGASSPTFRIDTATQGNVTGWYRLWMDALNTPDNPNPEQFEDIGQIVNFGFSLPVFDLGFIVVDNDFATGDFEDYHRIEGIRSTAFTPYARTVNTSSQSAGDIVEGDTASAANSTAGTSTYLFSGLVDSLRAVYLAGDLQDEPGDQIIGIHDFQFCAYDYGDAPATYGTTLGTGARHVLGTRSVWLGTNRPDGESDGQAAAGGAAATPDDTAQVGGIDDEDSVASFPPCPVNGTYSVTVGASNATSPAANAFLVGYIDWNRDGDFADANERSATTVVPQASADPTNFAITWSAVPANCGGTTSTYARFRISTTQAQVETPTGQADNGEVEDYQIPVNTLPVTVSWVASTTDGASTTVRWQTATETGNAQFRIWGLPSDGSRRRNLAQVPSRVFDSFGPQDYEVTVPGGKWASIVIEDRSVTGKNRSHGPFPVGTESGARADDLPIDWAAIRADNARTVKRSSLVATTEGLLRVSEAGIQRVTYEELLAAGIDLGGVPAPRITILDRGKSVTRFVSADPFGPGAYVEFLSARPATTLASPYDAYEIRVSDRRVTEPAVLASGPAGEGTVVDALSSFPDRLYTFGSPTDDPWFDEALVAHNGPASLFRTFDLADWAGGPVTLVLEGFGYLDFPTGGPDHHVVVSLNGAEIASDRFDGIRAWSRTIDVSGLVSAAGNTLEIALPRDTGQSIDRLAFEGYEVRFQRLSKARSGVFRGNAKQGYSITGFAPEPVTAWSESGAALRRSTSAGGSISIPALAGEVFAANESALRRPQVVAGIPAARSSSNAEYLIVSHPAFADSIDELVAFQTARGFEVEVVEVDAIYAAYGDHAPSAEALRGFLSASIKNGTVRYILLVGADTTDPWNHMGTGAVSYVPNAWVPGAEVVRWAPSDELLADVDGDRIADVPIGRLPVRTAGELSDVVAKLAAWESQVGPRAAFLLAGPSDADARLTTLNQSYQAALAGWSVTRAEVDLVGPDAARSALLAALDAGTPVVSYVGHSSPDRWDFSTLLGTADIAGLGNGDSPNLVLQWGCWNSYAVNPEYDSLSSRLLLAPGVGAAGTIGATTLTSDRVHERLALLFYDAVREGAPTLGDALRAAKIALRDEGGATDDVLLGMAILGDPATRLPAVSAIDGVAGIDRR